MYLYHNSTALVEIYHAVTLFTSDAAN